MTPTTLIAPAHLPTDRAEELDRLVPLPLDGRSRRVLAAQLAQRLAPAAWALGGFSSAEITVRRTGQADRCPAAAVVMGEPCGDGTVGVPPLLVVELAPCPQAPTWLDQGVAAVWVVGTGAALALARGRGPQLVLPPAALSVPGTGLRLALPVLPAG
jgi:hypothetical protein